MSEYIDLYNLELTGPFAAKFVQKDPAELPPGCILPEELNSIPELPPIDITLPDLDCTFDIEVPLVPLPFFCSPVISGQINATNCANSNTSMTGSASIQRVEGTECEYELTGDIEICGPCVPTFDVGNIDVRVNEGGANGGYLTLTGPECEKTFEGEININTGCALGIFTIADANVKNWVEGQTKPTLSFSSSCPAGTCCESVTITPSLDITACDSFKLEDSEPVSLNLPLKIGTLEIGNFSLGLNLQVQDGDNDCEKKLNLSKTAEGISLTGLSVHDLPVCHGNGTKTVYKVVMTEAPGTPTEDSACLFGEGGGGSTHPFKVHVASTDDFGGYVYVELDSWLMGSLKVNDKVTITGLGSNFYINPSTQAFIYLKVTFDANGVLPVSATIEHGTTWTTYPSPMGIAGSGGAQRQEFAYALIAYTQGDGGGFPFREKLSSGYEIVQCWTTHMRLFKDCYEGNDSLKLIGPHGAPGPA